MIWKGDMKVWLCYDYYVFIFGMEKKFRMVYKILCFWLFFFRDIYFSIDRFFNYV